MSEHRRSASTKLPASNSGSHAQSCDNLADTLTLDNKPFYQSFGHGIDTASRGSTRDNSSIGAPSTVSTPRTATRSTSIFGLTDSALRPSLGRAAQRTRSSVMHPHGRMKDSLTEAYNVIFSKSSLVSGLGFFADAYDLFVIDLVLAVLRGICIAEGHPYGAAEAGLIASATLFGAVAGQIGFGAVSDIVGRKVLFVVTGSLVVVGSLASAMVVWTVSPTFNIFKQLAVCRFVLGVGIGGEYPLAATVTSENCTSDRHRGKAVAAIFSMQGFGMLFSPICMLACLNLFNFSLEATWRICLAMGAVPSAIAVMFRFSLSESKVFKAEKEAVNILKSEAAAIASASTVMRDNSITHGLRSEASAPYQPQSSSSPSLPQRLSASVEMIPRLMYQPSTTFNGRTATDSTRVTTTPRDMHRAQSGHVVYPSTLSILRSYGSVLIGTCMTWFLLDVTLYGTGTFKSVVNESLVGADETHIPGADGTYMSTVAVVESDSRFALIIALMALPGYFLSVCFVDVIGRRRLQLGGFVMMTIIFAFLAALLALQASGVDSSFIVGMSVFAFGLTFLFSNFGPNVTTFILPTEVYPTRVRATCHGLSAAAGKLGGAVGALVFSPLNNAFGVPVVMGCCSTVALLGALVTYLYTEDATGDLRSMDTRTSYLMSLASKRQNRSNDVTLP